MAEHIPCVLAYNFSDLTIAVGGTAASDVIVNNDTNVANEDEENCCAENEKVGRLDVLLAKEWDAATEKGLFRYPFVEVPCKVLPGTYQFFAQLNPDRASKRREPQVINNISQPFDETQFNFNKINSHEVILQIQPWWSPASGDTHSDEGNAANNADLNAMHSRLSGDVSDHKIIINASPLEYGNVLIVPFRSWNLPQIITLDGLRLAIELMLLSRSSDFRIGFNSLCAFASVNHFHFHGYYLKHRLYLEHAKLKPMDRSPCFEFADYPAPGFVFVFRELENEAEFGDFVEQVYKTIEWMQENNVPHNLYMTRGSSKSNLNQFDALRVFVWGRTASHGNKACDAFNPALCELAGHLPLKTDEGYEKITEEVVVTELKNITLDTFNKIRLSIQALY